MLDVQNPQIDVDQIMRQIEAKVQQRRSMPPGPPPPSTPAPAASAGPWSFIEQVIARAQANSAIGAAVPAMSKLSGVKRRAAGVMAKAFIRLAQLITRDQRIYNQAVVEALQGLDGRLKAAEARATAFETDLVNRIARLQAELTATSEHHLAILRGEVSQLRADMVKTNAGVRGEFETDKANLEALRTAQAQTLAHLRTSITLQERRLTMLLEEARRRLPKPIEGKELQAFADELPHMSDAMYLAFEDDFRGSRDEIKRRLAVYLPRLKEAGAGAAQAPILELGCGRGELLELCRDEGLAASGVDTNAAAIAMCKERGLDASVGDAFDALHKAADGSLGALAAIHVIEHLPLAKVIELLDEAVRVLRPGGLVIFETPNPKNVLVGASHFYIDPTHRNPVHPQTIAYLAEARGLVRVEALMLHPPPTEMRIPGEGPLVNAFNEYFNGPQDYALIGYRA